MRDVLRQMMPPAALSAYRRLRYGPTVTLNTHFGDYGSWEAAVEVAGTYHTDLEVYGRRAEKERANPSPFDMQEVLAGLLLAARNGPISVLDYGGGLGTNYWQALLAMRNKIKSWEVVELTDLVEYGTANFRDDILKFTISGLEPLISRPDVILLNGVLQYLADPYETVESLLSLEAPFMVFDRLPLLPSSERFMTQIISPHLGGGKLAWRALNAERLAVLLNRYTCVMDRNHSVPPLGTNCIYACRVYQRAG